MNGRSFLSSDAEFLHMQNNVVETMKLYFILFGVRSGKYKQGLGK